MIENPERLAERIRLGEDQRLELKAVSIAGDRVRGPARESVADELAAFANAQGGTLVFGVDDRSREIVGVPEAQLDLVDRFVAELCHDSIRPPLMPAIHRVALPSEDGTSRAVICVEIRSSLFVHESPGGYFYRVGSSKRRMEPEFLGRLLQQRSQARLIRFDEQVVAGATLTDLDPALIDRFRTARTPKNGKARHDLLVKLAMARTDDSATLQPTVAGVLFASRTPERWLPNAYIQAVAYRGDGTPGADSGVGYQLDAKDITGPLDEQVAEACRFVTRNMKVGANKSIGRHDVPQYDLVAVFEAIVNAVAHRDYSMYGAKIRLRLFASRLEIYSPGALPNTMTVESLPLRQASRNEAITSLLAKCEIPTVLDGLETTRKTLMDRRGEGVSIVLDRSEALSGKRPVYRLIDESELKLTIFAAAPRKPKQASRKQSRGDS